MNLCFWCGKEGKYQFKTGRWCCNKNISGCLEIKKRKIYIRTKEIRQLQRTIMTGKSRPDMIGNNNIAKRPEIAQRISERLTGVPKTEEHNKKNSEAQIKKWKDPKYADAHSGSNHFNWNGGSSFEPYGIKFNEHLKTRIKQRDNFICQLCGITEEELKNKECVYIQHLRVHHIDYNKINNLPENLVTLCCECHGKTNYNRDQWQTGFKIYMTRSIQKEVMT